MNSKEVVFPIEFYSQKDVLNGLNSFDMKHVSFTFSFDKTEKGFDAYKISFAKKNYEKEADKTTVV